MEEDTAKYIYDLLRVGCRVTFESKESGFGRHVEVKAERMTPDPIDGTPTPGLCMTRVVGESEIDQSVSSSIHIHHAVREIARNLAESE